MRPLVFVGLCTLLAACDPSAPESVQLDAPPWGWTEVSADLPGSFPPLHRTVVADRRSAREMHFAIEANTTTTTRAVFVTFYERPAVRHSVARRLAYGDAPDTANLTDGAVFERVDPRSLDLPDAFARSAEAAYTMRNEEKGETGVIVRQCWEDLCAEAMAYGADAGFSGSENHHTDLLQTLTILR